MLNPSQRLMKLWRRLSLRHVRQVQKRRPNTCGSKRQPEGRGPKRHPKNSVSRSTPTTNGPLCSTDFLLRVTRAGRKLPLGREGHADFIERYLGISPDGGDGSMEVLFLVALFMIISAIAISLRSPVK